MKFTFEQCRADIAKRWRSMRVTREPASDAAARKINAGRERYEAVEAETGVPWQWIGLSHLREANCDFRGVLHNGEKIIGTGKKTRLVPAGRGPFANWHDAAVDAIKIKGLDQIDEWPIERQLYELERFNGFGYRNKGVPSAYIWAGSDQYSRGKYVADHVWSATAVDKQLGCAPVLKRLELLVAPKRPVSETVSKSPSLRLQINALLSGAVALVLSFWDWLTGWAAWLFSLLPFAASDVSSTVGATRTIAEQAGVPLPAKILIGITAACLILLFHRQLQQKRVSP
jgi:lysozyme family protein